MTVASVAETLARGEWRLYFELDTDVSGAGLEGTLRVSQDPAARGETLRVWGGINLGPRYVVTRSELFPSPETIPVWPKPYRVSGRHHRFRKLSRSSLAPYRFGLFSRHRRKSHRLYHAAVCRPAHDMAH